jgi:DNA-binding MarR family transcriptional regulator
VGSSVTNHWRTGFDLRDVREHVPRAREQYSVGMRPNESDVDVPLPALLHAARGAYSRVIHDRQSIVGIVDLPPHGAYIVGGLTIPVHAGQLFRELDLRESVAHRLMHALLERDFVKVATGVPKFDVPDLELTEKGRIAASAAASGVTAVNDELKVMLSPQELSSLRTGLIALIDIRERAEDHHD